ncbi:Ovarian cancer-associated protein 2 [Coemansia sp. RSA 2049]|nr:Ovarian cancer-associated protein 2 [Coemansia sp. RSA 2049]
MSGSSGQAMHRVLCLHGYTQNAKKFRDRTGPFRRNMKRRMELVYMTAPLEATEEFERSGGSDNKDGGPSTAGEEGPSAAWWNPRATPSETWVDIRRSAEAVMRTMRELGPFDGIVGFSQGAGMAAVVLALMRRAAEDNNEAADVDGGDGALVRGARALPPLRFAFLFAGFYPDVPQFDALLTAPAVAAAAAAGGSADREQSNCSSARRLRIAVPSLHVVGIRDAVVAPERGRELAARAFADTAVVAEHDGGHFVPCNAAWRNRYQAFLDSVDGAQQDPI